MSNRIIEATGNITKAETKINVISSLKRDERGQGKKLLKLIEQTDGIQERLQKFRQQQVERYCDYVMQVNFASSLLNLPHNFLSHVSEVDVTKTVTIESQTHLEALLNVTAVLYLLLFCFSPYLDLISCVLYKKKSCAL